VSTVADGRFAEVIEMPHSSAWPLVLGFFIAMVFVFLLLNKYGIAGIFGIACLLSLVGWHWTEPQDG
jgi:uncharacterized membrane protein YccC